MSDNLKREPFPTELLATLRSIAALRDPMLAHVAPAYRKQMPEMLAGTVEMDPPHARALLNALSPVNKVTQFRQDTEWRMQVLNWANAQERPKQRLIFKEQLQKAPAENSPPENPLPPVNPPNPNMESVPKDYGALREQFISSFGHATTASAVLAEFGLKRSGRVQGRFSPMDTEKVNAKISGLMKNAAPAAGMSVGDVHNLFRDLSTLGTATVQRSGDNYHARLMNEYVSAREQYLEFFHTVGARKADKTLKNMGLRADKVAGSVDGVRSAMREIQLDKVPLLWQGKASAALEGLLKAAHRLRHEEQSQERLR